MGGIIHYLTPYLQDAVLGLFADGSSKAVLDTWIQFTVEESPKVFFDNLSTEAVYTVDSITAIGQQADTYLTSVFDEAVSTAPSVELAELFKDISAKELIEKQHLSRSSDSLLDCNYSPLLHNK